MTGPDLPFAADILDNCLLITVSIQSRIDLGNFNSRYAAKTIQIGIESKAPQDFDVLAVLDL